MPLFPTVLTFLDESDSTFTFWDENDEFFLNFYRKFYWDKNRIFDKTWYPQNPKDEGNLLDQDFWVEKHTDESVEEEDLRCTCHFESFELNNKKPEETMDIIVNFEILTIESLDDHYKVKEIFEVKDTGNLNQPNLNRHGKITLTNIPKELFKELKNLYFRTTNDKWCNSNGVNWDDLIIRRPTKIRTVGAPAGYHPAHYTSSRNSGKGTSLRF